MRDVQRLDRTLLNSEFEISRALYDLMRGQGYSPYKTAAMIYRHGFLDGYDTQKRKTVEAYKKLYAIKEETTSPPEAIKEGSNENE